jgi:HK97 gp10 family phage protein
MAADVKFTVKGIADLKAALLGLAPNLRRRALRNALAAGGRVFAADAKRRAPVLAAPVLRNGVVIRKPGTVRQAIRVRTSRNARSKGDVGVFVNVAPAKGARFRTIKGGAALGLLNRRVQTRKNQRGAQSPNDPFYWRWLEFGTKKMSARPFLRPAIGRQGDAIRAIEDALGPQIQKLNVPVRFRR